MEEKYIKFYQSFHKGFLGKKSYSLFHSSQLPSSRIKIMKNLFVKLILKHARSSCTSLNYQFDDSQEQGIKIVNNTFSQMIILSFRFLIPGLPEKESRKSRTKHTLYPSQSKVYYLPEETMVVAIDGPYWDNPNPQGPNEREGLYVKKDISSKVDIDSTYSCKLNEYRLG